MNTVLKSKLQRFLAGGSLFPCALFYIVGIIWFLLLSQDEINHGTYLSENALLVGQVVERFDDLQSIQTYYAKFKELQSNFSFEHAKLRQWVAEEMRAIGLEVYTQNFTFSHSVLYPEEKAEGTNLYGIMRSPSGGRTEALLLTVPFSTHTDLGRPWTGGSVSLVLSLLKSLRRQIYWAKDIVVLFPDLEYAGVLAWIEAYHGGEKSAYLSWTELEGRSGNIQAGLNLEFTNPDIPSVDIFPEGINGLLANLDLVNTVVQLSHKHSIHSVVNGQLYFYSRDQFSTRLSNLIGLIRAVWTQAPGSLTGLHSLLINYQIPAVTLRGPSPYLYGYEQQTPTVRTGRFLEGILRSLNNLQERMHQSFWYYLLPNPSRYISIGVYMPPVLILIGSLLIKVIGLWVPAPKDSTQPSTSTDDTSHDEKEGEASETGYKHHTTDDDQAIRRRLGTKKPPTTDSLQPKTKHTVDKVKPENERFDLLSALTGVTLWILAAFGTGLGLLVCPKLVFGVVTKPWSRRFVIADHLMSKTLACCMTALFSLAMCLLPLITCLWQRLFTVRSSVPLLWKRTIVLVVWALFLACLTCLNVSASVMLSVPIVPVLLLFVHANAENKFISALFGLSWLLVSPVCLLVIGCWAYLNFFNEALLINTQALTMNNYWSCYSRSIMQPLMEADLFGGWTWSTFTSGFTSLWFLTWLYVVKAC